MFPPILPMMPICGKRGRGHPTLPQRFRLQVKSYGFSVVTVVPAVLGLPVMILTVPPLMVFIPATLTFRIQVAASIVGLVAVFAMVMDRAVEIGLSLFDGMLTLFAIVGVDRGGGGQEKD